MYNFKAIQPIEVEIFSLNQNGGLLEGVLLYARHVGATLFKKNSIIEKHCACALTASLSESIIKWIHTTQ